MIDTCKLHFNSEYLTDLIREYPKAIALLNLYGMQRLYDCLRCKEFREQTFREMNLNCDHKQMSLELIRHLHFVNEFGVQVINENLTYKEIRDELENHIWKFHDDESDEYRFSMNNNKFTLNKETKLSLISANQAGAIKQAT